MAAYCNNNNNVWTVAILCVCATGTKANWKSTRRICFDRVSNTHTINRLSCVFLFLIEIDDTHETNCNMDDKTGTRRRGVARPSYAEDEEGNNQNAMDEEEEDDEMEEDFLEEEEEKEEEEDEEMTNYDDSMIAVAVPAVVERSSRPRRVVVAPTKPHHHQPVPRSSLEGPPRNSNSSAKQKSYANFNKPTAATATNAATAVPLRSSSRSNKYTESMTDPTASLRDILSRREELADSDNATDEAATVPRSRATSKPKRHGPTAAKHASSPVKSPARRHAQNRNRLPQQRQQSRKNSQKSSSSSALELSSSSGDEESSDNDDDDEEETGEPLKVQRILASRTESKAKWKLICLSMNTSEIHYGSRWYQTTVDPKDPSSVSASDKNDNNNGNNNDNNNDSLLDEANPLISDHTEGDVLEERFLVKWADLSFLHVSWETLGDLVDQADAKAYLTTFSRKSVQGLLYTPDERCDGDYFDPAFVEIDRILSVQLPSPDDDDEDDNHPRRKQQLQQPRLTAETEDACGPQSFGMIMDKTDPQFDSGTGRQFLVKWGHTSYSESTYEFERDLIINEIEYKEPVKSFLRRNAKPSKQSRRSTLKSGEDEYKRLYNVFGNKSKLMEADREKAVEEYKQTLGNVIYKNGGQLRDYQAEGVAWMISNFVNLRSCILADEMGLGKVRSNPYIPFAVYQVNDIVQNFNLTV